MVSVFPAGHWLISVISVPTLDSQHHLLIWLPSCNSKSSSPCLTATTCPDCHHFPSGLLQQPSLGASTCHLPYINPFSTQKLEQFSFLNKVASLCFVKSLQLKSKLINMAQEPPGTSSLFLIFFTHCDLSHTTFFCCSWNKPSSLFYLSNVAYVVSSPWNTLFPTLHKGSFSSLPPCYFFQKAFFITQTRGGIIHLSFLFTSFLVPINILLFCLFVCLFESVLHLFHPGV